MKDYKYKYIACVVLLFLALSNVEVSAQVYTHTEMEAGLSKTTVTQVDTIRSRFFSKKFWHNWSVGVAGGASLYFGEDCHKVKFSKRLGPEAELYFMKRATPIIAFRGLVAYSKVNGWFPTNVGVHEWDGSEFYQNFHMLTVQLHTLFDISTAIYGYDPNRKWHVMPYAGVGVTRPWGPGRFNREILFALGANVKLALSKRLDLTLDARHIFVNPRQDYVVKHGRYYEGMQTLSLGLSCKLGKQGFRRLESTYQGEDGYAARRRATIIDNTIIVENAPETEVIPVPAPIIINDTIYINDCKILPLMLCFKINDPILYEQELARLDFYMENLEELMPDYRDRKYNITIVGSADKATGNAKINQRLSEQRADNLKQVLVNKFGIPASQIITVPQGDRNNRFEVASPNRAVYLTIE